jgi:hypothetical protein
MSVTLACKQCGHENEPQRIYCHECGAKLDRTLLPPEPSREVTYKEQKKRVEKITKPASGFFSGWFTSLIECLAAAFLVACLFLMAMPPADAPPTADKDKALNAPPLAMSLENVVYGPVQRTVSIKEDDINLYLQGAIRAKPTGIIGEEYQFVRAYVKLGDGGLRIYAHQTIYNYPLYAGVAYTLDVKDGALVTKNTGGWIGRLPIHPQITQFADFAFDRLWKALKREHDTFKKVQDVQVTPEKLTITAGGKQK